MFDPKAFQAAFFRRKAAGQQLRLLFDHLPSTMFFMKDSDGRFITVSRPNYERLGLKSEEEIIGKTDLDFFPPDIANKYRADDHMVMDSKQPRLGLIEIGIAPGGGLDLFIVNKYPVLDNAGKVIGVMGTIESRAGFEASFAPTEHLRRAVEFIEGNLDRLVTVSEIAVHAGLSERQLQREFQKSFAMSVMNYALRTRLHRAADALLKPGARSIDVAHEFGFADQSAFTKAFKKLFGCSPRDHQKKAAWAFAL